MIVTEFTVYFQVDYLCYCSPAYDQKLRLKSCSQNPVLGSEKIEPFTGVPTQKKLEHKLKSVDQSPEKSPIER